MGVADAVLLQVLEITLQGEAVSRMPMGFSPSRGTRHVHYCSVPAQLHPTLLCMHRVSQCASATGRTREASAKRPVSLKRFLLLKAGIQILQLSSDPILNNPSPAH